MEDLDGIHPARSTFVTVLAWLFIVLAGFATAISILQNIMIAVMFHEDEIARSMEQSKDVDKMPFFFKSFMAHPRYLFMAFLVVCAVVFIVSIGLLKRKNWARLMFIAIMGFGIAWNVFSIFMQFSMLSSFPSPDNDHFATGFKTMAIVMQIFLIVLAIGLSALFGWIIRKLASERIRNEFIVKR